MSRTMDPLSSGPAAAPARPNGNGHGSAHGNGHGSHGSHGSAVGPHPAAAAIHQAVQQIAGKHICPFCGNVNTTAAEPCPRCTMEDTPATRQATKARIGPWYVLQTRNPAAPGMRFSTLQALVNKGQVTPRSIVRGPTTHQLWRFAAHVRGLSREFGLCYSCGETIDRGAGLCPHCERPQEPPANPDALIELPQAPASRVTTREYEVSPDGPRPVREPRDTRDTREPRDSREPRDVRDDLQRNDAPRGEYADRVRTVAEASRIAANQQRKIDGRNLSAMELAAALQSDPSVLRSAGRFRTLKVLSVLLLLGAIGGGVWLYYRPDHRAASVQWLDQTWQSTKRKTGEWRSTLSKPAAPKPVAPAPAPAVKPPAPQAPQAPQGSQASTPKPAPPRSEPRADGWSQIWPDPEPKTDPETPLTAEQARQLRDQAFQAEARGDWQSAVRLWERLNAMPDHLRYRDTQTKLDIARRQLGR